MVIDLLIHPATKVLLWLGLVTTVQVALDVSLQGGGKSMMNRFVEVVIESDEAGIATGRVCHEP